MPFQDLEIETELPFLEQASPVDKKKGADDEETGGQDQNGLPGNLSNAILVGRLCQTPWRFTDTPYNAVPLEIVTAMRKMKRR